MSTASVLPAAISVRGAADQPTELTLEASDAGLTGVLLDDDKDGIAGEGDLLSSEPGAGELASDEMRLGDDLLLVGGIAVERDHLEPIEERPRDRFEHVRRGNEQHLRQVEVDLEVVVAERVVLGRIENLEQGA